MAERSERHVVVAAHGHCFDGLASAVMFTHLRQTTSQRPLRFSYKSCGYGPNMQNVPERWLRGDENAIVDFRYTPSSRLTWYFDHHVTAFATPEQERDALGKSDRYFYDPGYGSCTKLIADIGESRYGVRFDRFEELITWANRIDSASFESAEAAADRSEPIMQLAAVVEQKGDGDLLTMLAPRMLQEPIGELARSSEIQKLWAPIGAAAELTHQRIARGIERRGDVAWVDLHEAPLEASGKFVSYALCPDATYSVALIRMKQHYKVSVGYNPWSGHERRHDIAALCRSHGGGGHPVVGAVSVALDRLDEAQRIALAIVDDLNRAPAGR
jgi:hypothetical protein